MDEFFFLHNISSLLLGFSLLPCCVYLGFRNSRAKNGANLIFVKNIQLETGLIDIAVMHGFFSVRYSIVVC